MAMGGDGGAGKARHGEEEDGGGTRVADRSDSPVSEIRKSGMVWAVDGLRDCGLDGEKEGVLIKKRVFLLGSEFGIGNFCITILVQHTNMQEQTKDVPIGMLRTATRLLRKVQILIDLYVHGKTSITRSLESRSAWPLYAGTERYILACQQRLTSRLGGSCLPSGR